MKKRLFSILAVLVLAISLVIPVNAAQPLPPIEDAIINACTYGQEVDLSQYGISVNRLTALYTDLLMQGKLPWFASSEYGYSYNEETNLVSLFQPEILKGIDMTAYEQKVAQILAEQIHEGMEDWQIALALHDYLIVNAEYDENLLKLSGYNLLVDGSAVCSGYTAAYQDLMQRAGIECRYVISESMDHAWNQVKIDGKWYHVDLTWDDPTPNCEGFVDHTYFLVTDQEISAGKKPHYGWDSDISCTDTRFSDGFWRNISSPILFESADICYLMRFEDWASKLCRRDIKTGTEKVLYAEDAPGLDIGFGEYKYEHHGLSLRGGRLWFCSTSQVFSVSTDGSDRQTHYTNTGNTYIYSIHAGDAALKLTLMTHRGEASSQEVPLTPIGGHVHNFTDTVTKPTCQAPGYTTSVCGCGLECTSAPTATLEHDYKKADEKAPTLSEAGYISYVCRDCGYEHTEQLPALEVFDVLMENIYIVGAVGLAVVVGIPLLLRRKRR